MRGHDQGLWGKDDRRGSGVSVGGSGVSVGGSGVSEGSSGVNVGGSGILVGSPVLVGVGVGEDEDAGPR